MNEAGRLAGRTILVVGATGGLGRAASLACAREGAAVIVLGRKLAKLHRINDAIAAAGGDVSIYPLDLEGASPDDYVEMASRIDESYGKLDGILHCAAHFKALAPMQYTDPADIARAMHINVTAPSWLTMACISVLAKAGDAAVVFTVDAPERCEQPFWSGYGVANAARRALVPLWAKEFSADSGIRVHGLQPGPMRTELRGRAWMEDNDPNVRPPEAYADACVELLSAAGRDRIGQVWSVQA